MHQHRVYKLKQFSLSLSSAFSSSSAGNTRSVICSFYHFSFHTHLTAVTLLNFSTQLSILMRNLHSGPLMGWWHRKLWPPMEAAVHQSPLIPCHAVRHLFMSLLFTAPFLHARAHEANFPSTCRFICPYLNKTSPRTDGYC